MLLSRKFKLARVINVNRDPNSFDLVRIPGDLYVIRRRPGMKNPYGLHNGELVTADTVSRGLDCNCVCPACGHRLQSHQGDLKRPYFSHYRGSDCGAGYETAIHLMAKDILAEHKRLLLPELQVFSDANVVVEGRYTEREHLVKPWTRLNFDTVQLETRVDSFIPDVIMTKDARRLMVEIRVTHAVDKKKLDWVIENDHPMVEYDFSRFPRVVDRRELKSALIDTYKKRGMGRGKWIHHPKIEETKSKLTKQYLRNLEEERQATLDALRKTRVPVDPQQRLDFG